MNWPNGLTIARLVLGPVILMCIIFDAERLAFYLFLVAMVTDLYDGYLARRSGNVTEFGKLMDPLADKVLVSLVLIGFLVLGLPYIPFWMVAAVVGRELLILGFRTGALKGSEGFVTSRIAKWKTAAQMAWLSSVLLYVTILSWSGGSLKVPAVRPVEVVLWLLGIAAVVLTVVSGAEYLLEMRGVARARAAAAQARPGEKG